MKLCLRGGLAGIVALSLSLSLLAHDGVGPGKGSKADTPPGFGGHLPFMGYRIKMESHLTLDQLGSTGLGSAIWGWTDYGADGGPREYALYGMWNGTAFIDVTNKNNPQHVGFLPTATGNSAWRELKSYRDHAFIVSDGNGAHGMQVFDLRKLRENSGANYSGSAVNYSTAPSSYYTRYTGITNTHTIDINTASGYAYLFGTNTYSGGAHFVNVNTPMSPSAAGGYTAPTYGGGTSRYIHDGQVVLYSGPDTDHLGQEILFASNARTSSNVNDDTVTIVDVTDKGAPTTLSMLGHANARYIHQGWLTPDQRYFLVNDELDEYYNTSLIKTHVYDVSDLDNPVYKGAWSHPVASRNIDHNLFIRETPYGLMAFESNYTMGLRVIRIDDLGGATPQMTEYAWFDTYPADDAQGSFNGQWGNYPFFDSGIIIVGDRQNGLFVLSLVPEPSTWALAGLGCLAMGAWGLRRRRAA